MAANDPIVYEDSPPVRRTLDLRPDGVDCIPVLGLSNFRARGEAAGEHVHEGCMEFVYCLRGALAFETDEGTYPFLPGTVFASGPRQAHRLRHNPKGLTLYRILFEIPRARRRLFDLPAAESKWLARELTHIPRRAFPGTPRVKAAFELLFALYDGEARGTAARRCRMKAAVLDLLLALVDAAARSVSPRPPPAVAAAARRMREQPECDYPIERLAREAGMAAVTFSETFKRATGLPPHAWLVSCRIKAAQELLERSGRTIAAIAHSLRFSSSQHFAAMFRQTTGMTPTAWRKERRR